MPRLTPVDLYALRAERAEILKAIHAIDTELDRIEGTESPPPAEDEATEKEAANA